MMTINIHCHDCAPEQVSSAISVRDDGFYQATCPKGHITRLFLQQQLFEVLFDLGLFALLDGYPREAITSFSSALEKYYKFYVELVSIRRGVSLEVFEDSWKSVQNSSERQLGAYVSAYLIEMQAEPLLLGRKYVEIRNSVVHAGKIPTSKEAIGFGDAVLGVIQPVLRHLKETAQEDLTSSVRRHYNEIRRRYPKEASATNNYQSINTTISLSLSHKLPDRNVEKALESIRIRGRSW